MLLGDLVEPCDVADPRIVDQAIEPAEPRNGGIDHRLAAGYRGQIARRSHEPLASQLRDGLRNRIRVASVYRHRGTRFEEHLSSAPADTHGTARNQGPLAFHIE